MAENRKNQPHTDRFINTYIFYPTSSREPAYSDAGEERVSGKITAVIRTETPLFIPNSGTDHAFLVPDAPEEHKSYDFFTYSSVRKDMTLGEPNTKEPVIPGSEIRGMIRSIYEALTDSCYSSVTDGEPLYKRTSDHYTPALIRRTADGKFELVTRVNVHKISLNVLNRVRGLSDGQKVYLQTEAVKKQIRSKRGDFQEITQYRITGISTEQTADTDREGYVIKGEAGPSEMPRPKSKGRIIELKKQIPDGMPQTEEPVFLSQEDLASLDQVLKTYADEKINQNREKGHHGYQEYRAAWEAFKTGNAGEYMPVYYSRIGEDSSSIYYLSPACITKEAYRNTVGKILQRHGNLKPCSDPSDLCPACTLFGMIGQNGGRASSVRFADARYVAPGTAGSDDSMPDDGASVRRDTDRESPDCYMEPVTLQELSQPKISSAEFYLKKPENARFWTYDYKVTEDGHLELCPHEIEIAGRKFYWHSKLDIDAEKAPGKFFPKVPPGERNKTVRPVKPGTVFTEDIYFDNITKTQLRQLITILNISSTGERGYKLGTGKPLGLGSISMNVSECRIRTIRLNEAERSISYLEQSYKEFMDEEIPSFDAGAGALRDMHFEEENVKLLLKISDFHAADGFTVTYPITGEQLQDVQNGKPLNEGFKWWTLNRGGRIETRDKMRFRSSLPPLGEDDDVSLPADPEQNNPSSGAE